MRIIGVILFSIFYFTTSFAQINELERKLYDLCGVNFQKIATPEGYEAAYELKIKQPLDHTNPAKGHFYQKVYLSHKGFQQPNVIITQGYNRNANSVFELSKLLAANQLDVEHRFFGQSMPDSINYTYLTLEQATADLHHINQLFREIYTSDKWVSTGVSKGGQTTIFYRYFYPNDVNVSVPYVAPLNLSTEDRRIYQFLEKQGDRACREKIRDVQIAVLQNREASLQALKWFAKGADLKFNYLKFEEAFEYAVLEYPFSFWQWGTSCDIIPSKNQPLDSILNHFVAVSDLGFFSDRDINAYASHYQQAGTQMGYYGYEVAPFKDYIKALPNYKNPSAIFMPNKSPITFDGKLVKRVQEWIEAKGDKFIYINGAADTWSATAVPKNTSRDALWFNLEGKDHGHARIKNMTEAEKASLIAKLEEWLKIDIK